MAYTIGGKQNLPQIGDIITGVKIGEDRIADLAFKSGKTIPVHLGPKRLDQILGIPEESRYETIEIKPTTPKVQWWEFWRWHKVRGVKYQRGQECMDQLNEHFGSPDTIAEGPILYEKVRRLIKMDIPVIIERKKND